MAAKKDAKGRMSGKNNKPQFSNKNNIVGENAKRKDVKNPEALAAWLGMKKGKAAFTKKAAAAKVAKHKGGKK